MRSYFNAVVVTLSLILLARTSTAIDCENEVAYYITSQDEADLLYQSNCTTYTGSIIIATNSSMSISLDGVESIYGQLEIRDSSSLTNFTASSLNLVFGSFTLSNLQVLSEVSVPMLKDAKGLVLHNLPLLEALTLPDGFGHPEGDIYLYIDVSYTSLQQIDGLNPSSAQGVRFVGNSVMNSLNFSAATLIEELEVTMNGADTSLDLSSLETVSDMSLQNVNSVDFSSLTHVWGGILLQNNSFTEFSCPILIDCYGLTIIDNQNLAVVDFPLLHDVYGNFTVKDNVNLRILQGFGDLRTVILNVNITGNLSSVDLPRLSEVALDFYVSSSNGGFDCSGFDRASKIPGHFSGTYTCRASTSLGGKDTAIHWHKHKLSTGAKVGIAIGVVVGVILLSALSWCLWRRRVKSAAPK